MTRTDNQRRTRRRRFASAVGVAIALLTAVSGCALFSGTGDPSSAHTRHAAPTASPSPTSTISGIVIGSATPTPLATPTPSPTPTPAPIPTITPVPRGTVVAEGDVASPKGSIHFHYRMIADGDNTYTAEYSRFTSTVPVPVSVTLIDVPPRVGDGLTYHGVGDHSLGGPTTTAAPASTAPLNVSQPSYLGTLVTYSSVTSANGVPVELGPGKVLAVNAMHWSVPVRQSNVHPIDGGARPYADGTVTAKTASGAPKRYLVAQGDTTAMVASRFGIHVQDLIWLNPDLPGDGGNQYLYESTTLNLDPNSL
ncbi:LysM peptidoglycan-binding domain-containing protein [Leifsonia sp. NPDC058230]|uniref:LysM peptidoglycan-binding domain-containing protein n=1 Tax=Leifsonia sp. NPDC058230 TaxID=3346391 RepID=UPI0036DDFE93